MKFISKITEKEYEASKCVFLKNPKQAFLYIKHDCKLIDCFWDINAICFVFDRNETNKLYRAWNDHTLT